MFYCGPFIRAENPRRFAAFRKGLNVDIKPLRTFINKTWDEAVMPQLMEYVTIPALSPAFNPNWETTPHLADTLELARRFCLSMNLKNTGIQLLSEPGRTPILLMEIEATKRENTNSVLIYGHLDKQPPADGWDKNKGAWMPVIENNRLYGRGSADDGYSIFSAVTAVKALQDAGIAHPRITILIETCEESGSWDLEHYLAAYKKEIGTPGLVICLDSGCGDYERLWITTSLRGAIVGKLEARILSRNIHSGASGMVASSFRILRQILDRIEDAQTGALLLEQFYCPIPQARQDEIQQAADLIQGSLLSSLPMFNHASPVSDDPVELITNSTWKPAISYIGSDGFPPVNSAANVIRESTKLLLSIRTPPLLDTQTALQALKKTIEENPPYGAAVTLSGAKHANGWNMPDLGQSLKEAVNDASHICFNNTPCFAGEGGSIPFMTLLSETFSNAKFMITGVLGPESNAHGPNEFLHLPYVKKLTLGVAHILSRL